MSDETIDVDALRWVRLITPVAVPRYLIDQIKFKDYTTDDFFKYQQLNCVIQDENGIHANPFNHLYALIDDENMIKGILWFVIDPLSKHMVINTYTVNKNIWQKEPLKSKSVSKLSEFVKGIMKKLKIEKVYWITRYPKHSQKHGFKASKNVLMEYSEPDDLDDDKGGK